MLKIVIYIVLLTSLSAQAVNATDSSKTEDKSSLLDTNRNIRASDKTISDSNIIVQTCGKKISCGESRYRSLDGTCNNLQNSTWGATREPFAMLLGDGRPNSINISAQGNLLPNPRETSLKIFPSKNYLDPKWTLNTMQWGQILAHDISLTASTSIIDTPSPTCCNNEGQYTSESDSNRFCAAIPIPRTKNSYSADARQCFDFVRTVTTNDTGCTAAGAPSYPINENTCYLDLSLIYGVSDNQSKSLREGKGGRMLTVERNGGVWPPQAANAQETCTPSIPANDTCYVAGDPRINQNPELAVLQTMLLKEHNRKADTLSQMNGRWDDDKIFQETRRIIIAMYQQINYYEFLPILLGRDNMLENKIIYEDPTDYINDYNNEISAGITNEFTTAAFRYFHTLIRGRLDIVKENRNLERTLRLSDWYNRPSVIEEPDAFDGLARGLSYQPEDKADQYFDEETTQYLFRGNSTKGSDLRAIDIQRGRDHRLASYVALRRYCGLSVPKTFDDLSEYISKSNIKKLKSLYKLVDDIDLTVGGALEKHARGALMGPTYLCISLIQFYKIRTGDRFFYENGNNKNIAFTPSQLATIRKGSSLARLVCDNGINIKSMQPRAFELVSPKNKIVPCDSLPSVDLSLWKEKKQKKTGDNK
ncbi:peroxidase isoform X1 [Papilio machaon]|uniref:peroxidase isoform X1 n=2 Tax=Papilio machaon TaxID=76193 RepID=UPI001E664834|nr:peroxidase isoform X1 [Papilio machaon]XP_045535319.1 peroxidase isoform X1 [Papilio machaon]